MKNENNLEISQIPTCGTDLENLALLEGMVWGEIKSQCANIDRSIFRFRFLTRLSQRIVALLLLLLSLFVVLPPAAAEITRLISEQLPPIVPAQGYWFLSIFIWIGGGLICLLPIALLSGRISHAWALGIYLYIWQPFCAAMALAIIPLNDFSWVKAIGGFLGIIIVVVIGVAIIIGFLFLSRGTIIQNISFLLTLISLKEPVSPQDNQGGILPNKTKLAHNVISVLRPKLKSWGKTTWQSISLLVEHKSIEGGLQTQYASFILAALALLGLLPIIISDGFEVVFTNTASFLGIFSSQSGFPIKAESIQWLFVLLLTLLVIGTIYYFLRAYQTSYVYEIILLLSLTEQKDATVASPSNPPMKSKEPLLTTSNNPSLIHYWFMPIVLTAIAILFYDRIKSENK